MQYFTAITTSMLNRHFQLNPILIWEFEIAVRIIFLGILSRTTCKLIGEDIVYTRDLSVNRLLTSRAVLRNKIMAFVCFGEIITNVFAHIFSAAIGWWSPGWGGRNISGLRTCTDASLDISYLLV